MSVGAPTPFFFESQGRRLYAVAHRPAEPSRARGCVLVHPFMEERQDSHAVMRDLAERLAARGFATLRFDLFGAGDSEGEWREASIEGWRRDVCAAVDALRARTGVASVTAVGLRFGATLAALAAREAGVDAVAMVQPVVRGADYAHDLLTAHMTAEMVLHRRVGTTQEQLAESLAAGRSVNLFGYELTPAQYAGLCAIDLCRDAAALARTDTLLVEVVRTPTAREDRDLRALAAALGGAATVARAVEPQALYAEGRAHIARADEVLRAMLAWMEREDRGGARR